MEENYQLQVECLNLFLKCLLKGDVAIPESGIQEIPIQIAKKLTKTNFIFNTQVDKIRDGEILLKNKNKIKSDYTIVATEAKNLIDGYNNRSVKWKSCMETFILKLIKNLLEVV